MRTAVLSLAFATAALGGCATFDRGTTDRVAIQSTPDGATATSSLGGSCTTPCALEAARDASFSVTVSKAGFTSQTVAVGTRIASEGAADATANIATAGLGLAVDVASGALLEHVPNPVVVTLAAVAAPPAARTPSGKRHS